MKIYGLICVHTNYKNLEGLFITKELAEKWIKENDVSDSRYGSHRYVIEEWEVQEE